MAGGQQLDLQAIATTLLGAAEKTFTTLCGKGLAGNTSLKKMDIITWRHKMKVFGWEKFHKPAYVSAIFFYKNEQEMKSKKPIGSILLYLERREAQSLLKSMGLKVADENIDFESSALTEAEKTLLDTCGELCNIIAGGFKTELCSLGYPEFLISPPSNFVNDVDDLPYNESVNIKHEMFIPIGEKEAVYIDVILPML